MMDGFERWRKVDVFYESGPEKILKTRSGGGGGTVLFSESPYSSGKKGRRSGQGLSLRRKDRLYALGIHDEGKKREV